MDTQTRILKCKVRKIQKMDKKTFALFTFVFILFVLYSIMILYPFVFCLNASLKDGGNAFSSDPIGFAKEFKIVNYVKAFQEFKIGSVGFLSMTVNSIWYAVGGTVIQIMCSSMAAYVVARYKFFGRKFLYSLAIVIMIIPIYGALPAQYKLFTSLGMVDSPLILLYFTGSFGMSFLIIYSFFQSVPWAYAESAKIDGAGHTMVFFKIMFPMALPAISAMAIMGFVGAWNDYLTPILYLEKSFPTLATGIYVFQRVNMYTANQPVYFAGVIISLIPVIALFIGFQNTIMSNIYAGGLKG